MNSQQKGNKEEVLVIRDLYKSFGNKHVLKGIDFDLFKGENVVIMGQSGTGKSVLIRIIAGLVEPDKDMVKVFGQEVDKLDRKELIKLRLKIGFLFQHNALYDSMTVRENLEFPLIKNIRNITQDKINEAVDDVLDAVGLAETADQYPSELSGGQEKRIAIARTLILKPEIILYDEPTSALDPITSVEMNNLINQVKKRYKTGSIIITHDLTCARTTGDSILMLNEGKFIRKGNFEEVFDTDNEVVKGFYDYYFIK
ncbi:ABC transporter ATP-binding protein [Niastella vici]|uniref:ABC transporter ATP-binding protein n=1 Tax=Niastella vici TaxID=1703345 RepID=A0A1V9FTM9_9BACT|nr:ATP-binding cassette domain-containing protein [Niastella vici]OQP61702.1 ABC transporter ATP-binding protein [Niastella vici]